MLKALVRPGDRTSVSFLVTSYVATEEMTLCTRLLTLHFSLDLFIDISDGALSPKASTSRGSALGSINRDAAPQGLAPLVVTLRVDLPCLAPLHLFVLKCGLGTVSL